MGVVAVVEVVVVELAMGVATVDVAACWVPSVADLHMVEST